MPDGFEREMRIPHPRRGPRPLLRLLDELALLVFAHGVAVRLESLPLLLIRPVAQGRRDGLAELVLDRVGLRVARHLPDATRGVEMEASGSERARAA